jgi:hypothetical protein
MWRAELIANLVITGGGDEEDMQDILNEIISLEKEFNEGAKQRFNIQERPIDIRVQFDLRRTDECIKVFHNPKFKARPVQVIIAECEE